MLLYAFRRFLHIWLLRYNGPDKSHVLSQDEVEIQAKDPREKRYVWILNHCVKWLCSKKESVVGYFDSDVVVKKLQV